MSRYIFVKINDDITSIRRLKEMFPNITEEDFKDILESDPTYANGDIEAGKYSRWLLSLFNKNNLKKEDLYKAKEYLEKFDKKKVKFSNKDINTYKTLPDLYKAIEEVENKEPTKSELKRNVQKTDLDEDAELYMETENFKIYIPLTYEASCKLGSDTQWCTATRSKRGYYDTYTEDNNKLYIFINKGNPSEKYQWNTKERYTCDRKDKEISETSLCVKYPDLIKFFEKFGYDDIRKKVEKLKEYAEGKEYIYDGKGIDENLIPYLKKVRVSNNVESIKNGAFDDCGALESIEIPNGVINIEYGAFYDCKSLKNIELPNSLTSIGVSAFGNCKSLESIEIPNGVTSIRKYAFSECSSLKSIELPNSLANIELSAFSECSSLKSIKIPNSVTSIASFTFNGCKALKSVEIPSSVTRIGDYAFYGCYSLKDIKIPNSVTKIEQCGFYGCRSLESIEIPSSVTSIGDYAFEKCNLLKNVEIPESVTSIGANVFLHCHRDLVIKTKNPYVIEYCKGRKIKYSEE